MADQELIAMLREVRMEQRKLPAPPEARIASVLDVYIGGVRVGGVRSAHISYDGYWRNLVTGKQIPRRRLSIETIEVADDAGQQCLAHTFTSGAREFFRYLDHSFNGVIVAVDTDGYIDARGVMRFTVSETL